MSSSCNLFTLGCMEKAVITLSTGTAATGHGVGDAFDFNPDTYFKSSTAATHVIDIDLGSAQAIDAWGIWIHNYTTAFANEWIVTLKSDNNDNGSYSATTDQGTYQLPSDMTGPLIMPADLSGPVTKRYWRVAVARVSGSNIPELSGVFLFKQRAVTVGNMWPETESDDFAVTTLATHGGRLFPLGLGSRVITTYKRTWTISGDTNMTALRNAYADSKKNRFPLVLNEGSSYYYVYIDDMEFEREAVEYQLYNIALTFRAIPYIPAGETI